MKKARLTAAALLAGVLVAGAGLGTGPPGQARAEQPRTDRFGDPLPPGALARLGTLRYRSGGTLTCLAFSPRGKVIAVAPSGQGVILLDRATGRSLRRFREDANSRCLAFSPDGKALAIAGQVHNKRWSVHLVSVETAQELRRVGNQDKPISCLAFSPDGRWLAFGSDDLKLTLCEVATGKALYVVKDPQGVAWHVAFSLDGRTLASADRAGAVSLRDAATGTELHRLRCLKKDFNWFPDLIFSPDGRTLITYAERGQSVWDVRSGARLRWLATGFGEVRAIAQVPDGKTLALANAAGKISLWDWQRDKEVSHWRAGPDSFAVLAFAPDGKTLASVGNNENVVRLWDPSTGHELNGVDGHRAVVTSLAFSADGQTLFSADMERTVCTWDVRHAAERHRLVIPGQGSVAPAFSADRKVVAAMDQSVTSTIRLSSVDGRSLRRAFPRPPEKDGFPRALAFSPDGRLLASGGLNADLLLQETASGKIVRRLDAKTNAYAACFSPDGRLLATSRGPTRWPVAAVRIWDVATGRLRWELDKRYIALSLAFSSDGQFLAAAELGDHGIGVWDMRTGKEVQRFVASEYITWTVAFSPDGRFIASGGHGDVRPIHVWERASGGEVRTFTGFRHDRTFALVFAPNGRTLASAGRDPILLWDMTGQALGQGRHVHGSADVQACWADLAARDPRQAADAVYALTAAPELAVPFLQEHVPPIQTFDPMHFARLLADLNSSRFRIRQRATSELQAAGESIEPAVRQHLQEKLAPEVRKRLEHLLAHLNHGADTLRLVRAVQVLEYIGTPEVRKILHRLADGLPSARLTREAKAALTRLCGRPAG